jgi:DNA-directed RNA polymerase subunit RPC12/RpoP
MSQQERIRISFHCVDCGSDDILLVGANCSWNFSEQRFEYHDSADPSWVCTYCGNFNWQIDERDNSVMISL